MHDFPVLDVFSWSCKDDADIILAHVYRSARASNIARGRIWQLVERSRARVSETLENFIFYAHTRFGIHANLIAKRFSA